MTFTHGDQTPTLDVGEVVVDPPPDLPKPNQANLLTRLLPVAMVVATVGMAALYFTSGAARNPVFLLFPVMMLVSAVGSLVQGARGNQRSAELHDDRRRYLNYLDDIDESLVKIALAQHRSQWRRHPDPAVLWALASSPRRWERVPGDADFARVRVGVGTQPLSRRVVPRGSAPPDERDPVTHLALDRLLRERTTVADVPVTVALAEHTVVVVDGERADARALVRAMICQLVSFHGPSAVAVAAVVDGATQARWDWLKWLPHHASSAHVDGAGLARMTYRSMRQLPEVEAELMVVIVDQAHSRATGPAPAGTTVVAIGALADDWTGPQHRLERAGGGLPWQPDGLTEAQALACARRLAAFDDRATAGPVPDPAASWMQLVGIDHLDSVTPEAVWRVRSGRQRLRVPIGVDDDGAPVELDIKEAAYQGTGPHGLCVGATGSGKSELLRTLTLGLVATHPPEVLNLVLVDFKGGATFLGFERLRHVAAVITNLADEAHLVLRMRDAMAGEITRRQELLRAAGNFANVTAYERARTEGAGLAPLPTLFIVVDEFSELLSQHPDFVDLFVAIGRVGRSLGMHLLLASQRLDEGRIRGLETHLSYRICLKTFSASESRAVLGTAAAFELPNTPGVGYLKDAAGELVRFTTSHVSARRALPPASGPASRPAGAPTIFTAMPVGQVRTETPPPIDGGRAVIGTMLDRLADVGTRAHQVWLSPLSESAPLGALLTDAPPLVLPIGLVDNPFQQRRDVLMVDLRGADGHVAVVGGPRSGKSMTLRTVMLALAATHDPAAVQCYGLDFGGGTLSAARALPHVGAVAGRFDRELARRIISHLQTVVRDREAGLRDTGVRPVGDVFLFVDGWAVARQEFDGLEEAVTVIAAQGLSVGVHVVLTAGRWADLRSALKDQLGTRIELRLGDPAESELDRKRARSLAGRPAGHGITRDGLELVVALPRLDERADADGLDHALQAAAQRLRLDHPGLAAPQVLPMPTRVLHDAVVDQSPDGVVLGLDSELRPTSLDFTREAHALIIGEPQCGKTAALRLLCRELVRTNRQEDVALVIVDVRRTMLGVVETGHLRAYAASGTVALAVLNDVAAEVRTRLPGETVTQRQLRDRSWWSGPEVYVIVDDYDMVATAAGSPLAPLVELLPQAAELGLHVVLARRSSGAARAMFDPVLAGLRDAGCLGLMMSAHPDEGVLLGSVRPSPLPPGRATMVRRGHSAQLVQVAWSEPA